jgi:hypothetical protein
MSKITARLTPSCYGCIIILFFFPFINVQCNHSELERVKGIELATGYRVGTHSKDSLQQAINATDSVTHSVEHSYNSLNHSNDLDIERNNFATATFVLAMAGLVLSFLMQWRREMLQGIIGLAGMMSMFLMRVQLDSSYVRQNSPHENLFDADLTIEYETGYWLVLVLFLLIAAININDYIEQLKKGKVKITNGIPGD